MRARDLTRSAEAALARKPIEQTIAKTPSKEEQRLHDLTHLPYAAWCESCVKHRARPDQRRRSGQAREAGPAISFNFAFTHASGIGPLGSPEDDDGAQMGVADDESGALWLIAVCAETGYVLGLPLKAKSQLNLIAHESLSFTQVLGHEEVTYYSDNEPTLRQVSRLLVQARGAMGLKTKMRTTKIYDHAGNSLVENAIQRVRSVAATLMENVAKHTGLRFNGQHPLWTWACRHSAWLLNRYQPVQGATSYELVHGRPYKGKLCQYGEVVFAYTKPKQGFKADPRWKVGICLGKSELQDAWVIGDGSRVFLSKSVRRVEDSWQRYLPCFKGFAAYSWEYQTNFGGRIVPSKRLVVLEGPEVGLMLPGVQDILEGDQEAQEVLAYARSYAGKLEAQREAEEKEEKASREMVEQEETLKLAEDKRKSVVEDQELSLPMVMAPSVDIPHASVVDEEKNQLGPSRPSAFSLLDSPSTPRSAAQKVGQPAESSIPEAKKLKPTIEKLTPEHEGVDPDPKRAKQDPTIQHERRVTATQVGNDVFYHMDSIIGEEELVAWQDETDDQAMDELPDELWSKECPFGQGTSRTTSGLRT